MIFIYVLISDLGDFYAEEMLISAVSLRKYHPHDYILLLTDCDTVKAMQYHRKDLINFVNEIKTVDFPDNFNKIQRSRFLKTSLNKFTDKDFIFLDTDTIVLGRLDFKILREGRGDIRAVRAAHGCIMDRYRFGKHFRRYYAARGISYDEDVYPVKGYYNSGVLFCKNTARTNRFFNEWHNAWYNSSVEYSWNQDQIDFCLTNIKLENIVQPLDGCYNCQIGYADSVRYIEKAKVIHYFSNSAITSYYKFRNPEYLKHIRYNGVNDKIEQYISDSVIEYYDKMRLWLNKVPLSSDSIFTKIEKSLKYRLKTLIVYLAESRKVWKSPS